MTDTNKLKELAERATPGPWSAAWEEGDDTAWPNLFPVIQAGNGEVVIGNEGFYTDLEQDKANATFCAAANPQAILGLIADLEEARNGMEYQPIMRLKNEIDRLKAENEALLLGMRAILNAYDYADQYNKKDVAVEVMGDLRTLFKGATQ
ncbi:TPA: ead/Ea22-like family protein [Pseudomonas aeruginosa]|nr:ead/Ea22-like family protein [Pseudomonas aeruginosa]